MVHVVHYWNGVYYISNVRISHRLQSYSRTLSYCITDVLRDNILCIRWLQSFKRCHGYATMILNQIIHDSRVNNIRMIILDDCSDHSRKSRNIYRRVGFKYESDIGPEMLLMLRH